MTRKQRLVIVLLGLADCVVLGGLIGVMILAPRLMATQPAVAPPTASTAETSTPALPATWTPTLSPSPAPTATRFPTSTPAPTRTPTPATTSPPTRTPTPSPIPLDNADFEDILPDSIPGWEVAATINWEPGDDFDAEDSYARPFFKPADDPRRIINGTTLQVESAYQYVKFAVTLYQSVAVPPETRIQFEIEAGGYSSPGGIQVRVGIDPAGGVACENGLWGTMQVADEGSGVISMRSPEAVAGPEGQVTVCFYAEPQYAAASKAAFFDDALLLALASEP